MVRGIMKSLWGNEFLVNSGVPVLYAKMETLPLSLGSYLVIADSCGGGVQQKPT